MARLIRMDQLGAHDAGGVDGRRPEAVEAAAAALRAELDAGYYAVVTQGEGRAEQVTELPADAELVILRRPIAGGLSRQRRAAGDARPSTGGAPMDAARLRMLRARLDGHDRRPHRAAARGRGARCWS